MKNSSNPFYRIDWLVFVPVLILMIVGTLFIFSSGVSSTGKIIKNEYLKQIIWIAFGLIILVLFAVLKYEVYRDLAIPIFVFLLLLVLITSLIGRTVNGSKNWLGIGELGIQPSEFLKIATIIVFSLLVEKWGTKLRSIQYFILSIGFMLIPIGFVFIQQDLGTALVFFPIFFFIIVVGGAQLRHILYVVIFTVIFVLFVFLPSWDQYLSKSHNPMFSVFNNHMLSLIVFGTIALVGLFSLAGFIIYKRQYFYIIMYISSIPVFAFVISFVVRNLLKEYQMLRLLVFLDPYFDSKRAGWNIIQSLTAVGSGGIAGKGYLQGTQSHFQFLPEQSTDFIFSIISEEWGFLGAILIFVCFLVLCFRILHISRKAKDQFGANIAAGVAGMIFFHLLINVGMAIGVMPVTGIPLLFVSYGGSSLWAVLWAVGIVMSVNANRFQF